MNHEIKATNLNKNKRHSKHDARELHLFIAWEKARSKEKLIKEEIKKNFDICDIYDVKWSEEKFSENLTRFYGANLPQGSNKERHIGNGRFLLFIVLDHNVCYESRRTSKGDQIVNINTFDLKETLRLKTGGGHKIHATNSLKEVNHDLSLLLGVNSADYLSNHQGFNSVVKPLERNLTGCE